MSIHRPRSERFTPSTSGEKSEESFADSRFDFLSFAADLDLFPFVPRIEEIVGLVEEDVLARNPLDREATFNTKHSNRVTDYPQKISKFLVRVQTCKANTTCSLK